MNSIDTSLANLTIKDDWLIIMRFTLEDYEVNLKNQTEIKEALLTLIGERSSPYAMLVLPGKYGGITKEAREYEMF
ncbi:MAG: hypothetical protein JKY54_19575, partial [Flavobacteriales bacterium]|nr:hypothetical protein [Flavobacteriales bacterium]